MDRQTAIEVMGELIRAEQSGAALRFGESGVFVSSPDVELSDVVRRIASVSRDHIARLAEMLLRRGGSPPPRGSDLRTGDIHFQELRALLPRLIESEQELARRYRRAVRFLESDPDLLLAIQQMGEEHTRFADQLAGFSSDPVTAAT